jgi:catechol 2,3-dioxygenase-like lactoylglutathione lyase family enzyme
MKLEFVYTPVSDIKAALEFYRDGLGFQEAWREGEATISLSLPNSDVQMMLDLVEEPTRPGPFFVVESVAKFRIEHPNLDYTGETFEIPGGYMTSFTDPWGNLVYLLDQSTEEAP